MILALSLICEWQYLIYYINTTVMKNIMHILTLHIHREICILLECLESTFEIVPNIPLKQTMILSLIRHLTMMTDMLMIRVDISLRIFLCF